MALKRSSLFVRALVLASILGAVADAQPSQGALATSLRSGTVAEKRLALAAVSTLGPANSGPELRSALYEALQQEGAAAFERYQDNRHGRPFRPPEDPELVSRITEVVVEFKDPQSIPALASVLGFGFLSIRALASFGEQAAPAVLEVVTSADSRYEAVNHGLVALRFMVEGAGTPPISAGTRGRIRSAVEQRLVAKPLFISTTWWAIDLAAVLDDPGLRQVIEKIASDPAESVARGASDAQTIEQTRKRAADRLAGVPPLPRWMP